MYNFEYVTEKQLSPAKQDLIRIINSVQDLIHQEFTFRYDFTGSVEWNMATYDAGTNVGFDFDVNLCVDNRKNNLSAKEFRTKIRAALDRIAPSFGYDYAEDSTRVITIKFKDKQKSRILHSCDFAIVNDYVDNKGHKRQKYIRFNKKRNNYTWEEQPKGYYLLSKKAGWIKRNEYWNEMRDLYLRKKNQNNDFDKHSRNIYAETIHEICQKYGYYNKG